MIHLTLPSNSTIFGYSLSPQNKFERVFRSILYITNFIFISFKFSDHQYGVPKGVCLSTGCVHAASDILSRLDESINPCEDFYSFACGGFIKTRSIPDDSSAYSSFVEVHEKLRKQLRTILEEHENRDDIPAIQVVKNYYKACMNEGE